MGSVPGVQEMPMQGKWQLRKQGILYNTTFWLPENVEQLTVENV